MKTTRRKFVRTSSALAASTLVPSSFLFSGFKPKKEKLGVALVGLGYYSRDLLAPALQKNQQL